MGDKTYKYPKIWFKNNLVAVPSSVPWKCDSCVFRGAAPCPRMMCTYFDDETGLLVSVYWTGKQIKVNFCAWPELMDWFNSTPPAMINDIVADVMNQAVKKEQENTR